MPFTHVFRSPPHVYRTVYLLACEIEHLKGMFLALRTERPTWRHITDTYDYYRTLYAYHAPIHNSLFLVRIARGNEYPGSAAN